MKDDTRRGGYYTFKGAPREATRSESHFVEPRRDERVACTFANHCALCYANNGSGETPIGKNVYPRAPDLRLAYTQSMSDGEMFWVIHNDIRFTAMPAWGEGDPAEDKDSRKSVLFIRHLPQLTPEELGQMKTFNPSTKKDLDEAASFGQACKETMRRQHGLIEVSITEGDGETAVVRRNPTVCMSGITEHDP